MKTKGIIMLALVTTLLLSSITYGCDFSFNNGLSSNVVTPTVGHVPQGWYCSAEDSYGTYVDSDGTKWGLIGYTDNTDDDFVQIYYGDVPPELKGRENDRDALIARAIVESATFEAYEVSEMIVAGQLAGCVEAYNSIYDVYEMEIVFVKGSTCVDIYACCDPTYEDSTQVMSLIDSINLWE